MSKRLVPGQDSLKVESNGAVTIGDVTISAAGTNTMIVPDGWILGIGPALERIVFDYAGYVSVLGAYLGVAIAVPISRLHVVTETTTTPATFDKYHDSAGGAGYTGRKARGTLAVPTPALLGDDLAFFASRGYHSGDAFSGNTALVKMKAVENFTATTQGTDIIFATTPAGTAARADIIAFLNNGRAGFGKMASLLGKVHIDQASASAAIPVIYLDQADVSEEIAQITSTAGVGNAIELVGGKALTVTEFVKITINGNTRYLQAGTIA